MDFGRLDTMPRMANHTEALRHLHEVQKELADVCDRLDAGPRQIRVRKRRLADAESQVEAAEAELKRVRSVADQKNLDLKSREARITDLKVKLNNAQTNKEYDAITGQISADESANTVLEDEILDVFERVDAASSTLAEAKAAVEKAQADLKAAEEKWAADEAGLRAEQARLHDKSRESDAFIGGADREKFRRSAEADGDDSMATVEDGVCTGCQHKIRPQQLVFVKQGQIVFCGSCDRLLYRDAAPVVT